MSPRVPTFKVGDYVRVMQTREMVQKKLANERGRIVGWWEAAQAWHVQLQYGTFAIGAHHLMKMGKPPIKKEPPAGTE